MTNSKTDIERYIRQLSLPDFSTASQNALRTSCLLMAGAGGLGATALPYLAAAGIGQITIFDGDDVELSNLHRQTIFREDDIGQNKAECAADYLKALNGDCEVLSFPEHIDESSANTLDHLDFQIIIDGTDNFEAKILLNDLSIQHKVPFITASVFRGQVMAGVFFGADAKSPCYRCLFPDLPDDAQNCSEAGLLGPVAGIGGLLMAQMTIQSIIWPEQKIAPGHVVTLDLETYRMTRLKQHKRHDCAHCKDGDVKPMTRPPQNREPIPLLTPSELKGQDYVLIDVRSDDEVAASPRAGALHIELQTLPSRLDELPQGKRIAFACAANVRSRMAAEIARDMGFDDVCVYDVLAS